MAVQCSGHTRTLAYQEARQAVATVIQEFTLTDVQIPEFEWVCALLDALAACKLRRAVGPDAALVEFIRAAGIFYTRLVAQVCKAAWCPSCGGEGRWRPSPASRRSR